MTARRRLDRGTLRAAGFVALLTVTFVVTNTAVAAAATADGPGTGGGLLGPLDIMTGEGVPLSSYQLEAMPVASQPQGGIPAVDLVTTGRLPDLDVVGDIQRLVLGGLFTLVRLLVGLCGWLISFVFRFPLITMLTRPAQQIADAYERHVVAPLGLEGLLLAWAFVFGLILFVRGKAGTGLGEIALTLVIAALAASAFVRPDYLLGKDGPLDQTHQAAVEVASITTASYFGTPARGGRPCDSAVGPAHEACVKEKAEAKTVVDPVQRALTDSLVVKPYMLLQYGRVLDPKSPGDAAAYKAHLKWVKSSRPKQEPNGVDRSKCEGVVGPLKQDCERRLEEAGGQKGSANKDCKLLFGSAKEACENPCASLADPAKDYCENGNGPRGTKSRDSAYSELVKDLQDAGPVGREAAEYAQEPTWDRVWSVAALLFAVLVVTLMIVSMAVVMLGAQAADAAAAAGGPIAWVWSMLPGPSRMLLWRWAGVFIASALVSFMAALCLPMFGIAVDAVLSDSDADLMVERLLLVDAIAVAFLVMHRRVLAAASGFGQRVATRMRYRKVGGSHLRGDSSEIGAALAEHGPAGGGVGRRGGQSSAHGAFGARLASLGSLAAMSDGAGMPMSPGRFIGDALAEGKRGLAPFAVALRVGHAALIGPGPGQHPASQALAGAARGTGGSGSGSGEVVADQWTGEILHDPATDRPLLGSRIHARASRLRGYRIASRTARLAYGATLGLPRNLGRARGAASEFTDDARTQLRVAAHQVREDGSRWADGGRLVRDGVDHAGQRLATAWQVHDPVGSVRDTAVAAALATAPLSVSSHGRESTPRTSISAPRAEAGREPRPRRRPEPAATAPQADARNTGGSPAGAADEEAQAQAANAARLRAIFDARAAEHRRREGGER
ncbi:hypothetical protein [Streptomyces sp. NPDC001389]|uniref:hypothetical protein n=1 Tax=Streptomyces sp. NPDC001389 TaxID=3364569 RepID=UPI00368896AE